MFDHESYQARLNYYTHVAKYGSTELVRQHARNKLLEIRATMEMTGEGDDCC